MKKNEICLIIGIILYLITVIIDNFIVDIPDYLEAILYIICIIVLLFSFIFDASFMARVKSYSWPKKICYLILIILDVFLLGFFDIFSEILYFILLLVLNIGVIFLIKRFIK